MTIVVFQQHGRYFLKDQNQTSRDKHDSITDKTILDGVCTRLDIAKVRLSELGDTAIGLDGAAQWIECQPVNQRVTV